MPSTKISQLGLTARMALPACSAARRQSVAGLPSPQVAIAVRFVVQVGADDRGVAGVALGQRHPVVDPGLLRVHRAAGDVPQLLVGVVAGHGAVLVEDDAQADLPGVGDDLVQDLQAAQTLAGRG